MKTKKIFLLIVSVILVIAVSITAFVVTKSKDKYADKLMKALAKQEKVTVKEIFDFEFDRAYIFGQPDCYFDGRSFAEDHGLNISIEQVPIGTADYNQRIVFVDKNGDFVYEFSCVYDTLNIKSKGIVIYPDTVIEKMRYTSKDELTVVFISDERYCNVETHKAGPIFNTKNIARITFYSYYGESKGSDVPSENMAEIIAWLDTFKISNEVVDEMIPPGTNTWHVEIEYTNGFVIKKGMSTWLFNGSHYYLESDTPPECFDEIMSRTSLD